VAFSADFGAAPAPVVPPSQWRLSFTPYGWLPWLQGDMTVKGRSVDLNVSPIQVLEHLERVPFMGYAEAAMVPSLSTVTFSMPTSASARMASDRAA
jgi:hypothetical protein